MNPDALTLIKDDKDNRTWEFQLQIKMDWVVKRYVEMPMIASSQLFTHLSIFAEICDAMGPKIHLCRLQMMDGIDLTVGPNEFQT